MLRFTFGLSLALALCLGVNSADAQFSDNFDSYTAGDVLDGVNGWEGWDGSGALFAGVVSSAQANSAPNSMEVGLLSNGNYVDAINTMGGQPTTGCWEFTAQMYVPSSVTAGAGQYWIMLNTYTVPGTFNWSIELLFDPATGLVTDDFDDGSGFSYSYPRDSWMELKAIIDLDNNTVTHYVDGQMVGAADQSWSERGSTGGANQIGALDIFSFNTDAVYWDDIDMIACPPTGGCADPSVYTKFRGNDVGTPSVGDFAGPDGTTASYNPGFTINNTEAPVWLIFDYAAPATNEVQVTSGAGTPGLEMTVEYWDGAAYVVIGTADETFNTLTTETFSLGGASTDRVRVGWRKAGFTINFPWVVNVDAVGLCN